MRGRRAPLSPIRRIARNGRTARGRTLTAANSPESSLFARKIATLGLRPGDRILVMIPNIVEGVIAILGVMQAGFVPCPLNVVSAQDAIIAAREQVKAAAIVTVCRYAHLTPAQSPAKQPAATTGSASLRLSREDAARRDPAVGLAGRRPFGRDPGCAAAAPDRDRDLRRAWPWRGLHPHPCPLVSEALALSAISGLTSRGSLLGTFTPVSAAGVIATVAAPLISGAQVQLHGPFSPETLGRQLARAPGGDPDTSVRGRGGRAQPRGA